MFQAVDLNKPVDKKLYKGTNPTCHNFNQTTATADSAPLLVGFSTGQIQLIDPIKKELSKLYNEDVGNLWYVKSNKLYQDDIYFAPKFLIM